MSELCKTPEGKEEHCAHKRNNKKKNDMLVPVSCASTTCSNSSGSKLNPELMNKYNVVKKLNTQKVFLATAMKRKPNDMNDASYKISAKKKYIC